MSVPRSDPVVRTSGPNATTAVRKSHQFDEQKLDNYLVQHISTFTPGLKVRQFGYGQSNPTFMLTDGAGKKYALRKQPPGKLLKTAHAIDREYKVLTALSKVKFPVPKTYLLCEDPSVIGTSFYVMDFVEGRVFTDPKLPGFSPQQKAAVYDAMNRVLVQLHCISFEKIGLGDFGKKQDYFVRQVPCSVFLNA